MERRLFHFSYPLRPSRSEPLLHALRDGDAFAELEPALLKEGYDYHGLILNYPAPDFKRESPALSDSDLIVLTTRPPTPYESETEQRHMTLSGEELEKSILSVVNLYFRQHTRSHMKLSNEMADQLTKPDRGEIEFRVRNGAHYKRHKMPYAKKRDQMIWQTRTNETALTAAFLLFTNLWTGGPLLLNAFGMDGPTTLIWCYLLRTRFPEFLKPHQFVMAELTTEPFPRKPEDLSFAKDWAVDILVKQELPHGA